MGSNERKCCRDGLGAKKWSVVSDIVGGFLLVYYNDNFVKTAITIRLLNWRVSEGPNRLKLKLNSVRVTWVGLMFCYFVSTKLVGFTGIPVGMS